MATLHLISTTAGLDPCLRVAAEGDVVLLIANGVYAAVAAAAPPRALLALEADVTARGLQQRLGGLVRVIEDDEFVALAVAHQPIVSWR